MFSRGVISALSLATAAKAVQPGAPAPVAAPMRELQWGQVNFLHTTDTHGWLGGHLQEAQYSADWGDYVSFTEHMHRKADEQGVDLLVIDTGDRIEGNGLYDASDPKGKYTFNIFREQAVDALCTGNHELYHEDSVDREHNTTVPYFKNQYIASNLDYIEPETGNAIPQAQRYIKFKTKNQGYNVVALGFLFDFDRNANNSVVQPVEETMKEEWFQRAIKEKPDLFVVLGHVGLRMDEFETIFKVIRNQNWFTPIAFFGGHAHVRDARKFDDKAFAIASGRYLETIGWMSVDGIKKKNKGDFSAEAAVSFKRRYIDNNLFNMQYHTGLDEKSFPTEHGRNVSQMIADSRKALNLDHTFGCAPQDLWMTRAPYPSNGSIFTWLEKQVVPQAVISEERADKPRLTITNTGAVRFDIFKGPFTKDSTFLISPFTSRYNYIPDVSYPVASKVLTMLNSGGQVLGSGLDLRDMRIPELMDPSPYLKKDTLAEEPMFRIQDGAQKPLGGNADDPDQGPELIGGYTTKDDMGTEGDDAVHAPIKFYDVPNCIQSEVAFPAEGKPATVDLVFIDYIQPYVIPALKFSGGDYDTEDVRVYSNDTLTDVIANWVKENWADNC